MRKIKATKESLEKITELDFTPDKNRLDDEWVNQIRMITYYGNLLRKARMEQDAAKRAIDLMEADLSTKVRKNPVKFGLEKITEVAIKEIVTKRVLSDQVYDEYLMAKDRVNHFQVAVTALEHRKKAMEDLVFLWGAQYFGEPRKQKGENPQVQEGIKIRSMSREIDKSNKRKTK